MKYPEAARVTNDQKRITNNTLNDAAVELRELLEKPPWAIHGLEVPQLRVEPMVYLGIEGLSPGYLLNGGFDKSVDLLPGWPGEGVVNVIEALRQNQQSEEFEAYVSTFPVKDFQREFGKRRCIPEGAVSPFSSKHKTKATLCLQAFRTSLETDWMSAPWIAPAKHSYSEEPESRKQKNAFETTSRNRHLGV